MPVPASSPASRDRTAASQIASVPTTPDGAVNDRVLREVRRVLGTLRYGSVTLIVQDGRVVQVETTSKVRLNADGNGRGS